MELAKFLRGLCLLVALFQATPSVESANIVFFFGFSSYSHRVPAWPLAEALADKGHKVTFISPFPGKSPNPKINDYVPTTLKEMMADFEDNFDMVKNRKSGTRFMDWALLPMFGKMVCEKIYEDQEFIKWVKSQKVDLIFMDALANDCAYGMSHFWGSKVILFDTTSPFSHFTQPHGLPDETSWIPMFEFSFPADMSFSQRLINGMIPVVWHYYRKFGFYPRLEELTREKLGIEVPSFEDLERNVSLIFLNTHYSEEFARSLPPNTISVGGIAYKEKSKPLPKELDDFLKKGKEFIYFSFGSQMDFLKLDPPVQQAFVGALKSFPHIQFVWKVNNLTLAQEFPNKNVYIAKWMPQQDILAHPKVRAFITHSGLLGIQESVENAVPLISFPIFAEQDYNAERIHRREYGIRLEITTISQPEIEDAINKILTEPKYRDNMKMLSKMYKDRPEKPLDTALWWTDYVLRHTPEELAVLRPNVVFQPWWKRRQLDVWLTILLSTITILLISVVLVYKILKCVCCGKSKPSANDKRNNRKKNQ